MSASVVSREQSLCSGHDRPRLTTKGGCALDGQAFWFDGRMISHRGFFTDRPVAERLEQVFAKETGDPNAQACAEQLREAIRQYDEAQRGHAA